jgi:hypothetical protein
MTSRCRLTPAGLFSELIQCNRQFDTQADMPYNDMHIFMFIFSGAKNCKH